MRTLLSVGSVRKDPELQSVHGGDEYMNQYVTGTVIRELREKNKMTQIQLAEKLGVSDKTISKWETGKGYPDITLLEPIAKTFRISVTELISGNTIRNAMYPQICCGPNSMSARSAAMPSTVWERRPFTATA